MFRFGFISELAKNPVSSAPIVPPMPCTPERVERVVVAEHRFSLVHAKYGTTPAKNTDDQRATGGDEAGRPA